MEALTATHFIDFSSASGSCLHRTLVLQHFQEGCQEKVVLLKLPRKKLYFWLSGLLYYNFWLKVWRQRLRLAGGHHPLPVPLPLLLLEAPPQHHGDHNQQNETSWVSINILIQALVPVLLCLTCWLRDLHTGFLLTASFAILIFRSRIPLDCHSWLMICSKVWSKYCWSFALIDVCFRGELALLLGLILLMELLVGRITFKRCSHISSK